MFRTETKETTEIRFEDGFFDDMIKGIEKLVTTSPKGNFDSGWNAALKNCVYKLYAFFGRGTPPIDVLNVLTPLQPDSDKEERDMVVAAFFDKLVSEILKARIPNPVYEDHKAWNSAIHVSLIRIYNFFGKGEPPEKISNLFLDSIKAPDTSDKADSSNVTEKCSAQIGEIRPLIEDPITHPSWYNRGGIETLDFIEAKGLNFTRGNAVKYITRAGYKDPAQEIQDLRKARFYIDWEINRLKEKG